MWYGMNMRKNTIFPLVIIAILVVGFFGWRMFKTEIPVRTVTDFISCAQAGYPLMESYPRQCRTPDGRVFVEQITLDKSDLIVVDSPKPNEVVSSPLVVKGRARGNWFFEANFPIELHAVALGTDGASDITTIVKTTIAQAKSDWMTTEFVPFEAMIDFESADFFSGDALLVLKKDNPSGLPQNDAELRISIRVGPSDGTKASVCKPTGCSRQVCSDKEVITSCEYRSEYACYRLAKCERQINGRCEWTKTLQYSQCLTEGIEFGPEPDLPI